MVATGSLALSQRRYSSANPPETNTQPEIKEEQQNYQDDAQTAKMRNVPKSVACIYSDVKQTPFKDWSVSPSTNSPADPYPAWLKGTWSVKGKFSRAEFPLGRKKLIPSIAGARRMSVVPMPNIGEDVDFYVRYEPNPQNQDAIEPNWEYNMGQSLSSFWREARLISAKYRATSPPKLTVEYSGPTRKYKDVQQGASVTFINTESFLYDNNTFFIGEDIEQENLEQDLITRYTHVRNFERRTDGRIISRQRVAAFADPRVDEKLAEEAEGRPIAVYEYIYLLTPFNEAPPEAKFA